MMDGVTEIGVVALDDCMAAVVINPEGRVALVFYPYREDAELNDEGMIEPEFVAECSVVAAKDLVQRLIHAARHAQE